MSLNTNLSLDITILVAFPVIVYPDLTKGGTLQSMD